MGRDSPNPGINYGMFSGLLTICPLFSASHDLHTTGRSDLLNIKYAGLTIMQGYLHRKWWHDCMKIIPGYTAHAVQEEIRSHDLLNA
jgi:hypothetical protein